jgi:hypothetical protein
MWIALQTDARWKVEDQLKVVFCSECNKTLWVGSFKTHLKTTHKLDSKKIALLYTDLEESLAEEGYAVSQDSPKQLLDRLASFYKEQVPLPLVPVLQSYLCCTLEHPDGLCYCVKDKVKMMEHLHHSHQSNES